MPQVRESFYRDKLALGIEDSKIEVSCPNGIIDVLTPEEIIELKVFRNWKEGIGQLLSYGLYYSEHKMRLHLILDDPSNYNLVLEQIKPTCERLNIKLSYEMRKDKEVNVYKIGGENFRSIDALKTKVKHIRIQYVSKETEMSIEHKTFIISLINLAPWVVKKFGSEIIDVRVIPDNYDKKGKKLSTGHFQVKSKTSSWQSISIQNYIEQSFLSVNHETVYIPRDKVAA